MKWQPSKAQTSQAGKNRDLDKLIENLALTAAFFSRIPLPQILGKRISHDAELAQASEMFPIAGLLIALPVACIWYLAGLVLPAGIAAGLAIALGFLVTGGLHEDGLADCADGLGATLKRERALEIMRDSTIGTYGTLALITSVLLRWGALASLSPLSGVLALLIAHSGSRTAMTFAMRFSTYAPKDGLGKQAQGISNASFLTAVIISGVIAFSAGLLWGMLALLSGWAIAWLFLKRLEVRLGGYTGDGLGAMQQLAEITIFITLAGAWS